LISDIFANLLPLCLWGEHPSCAIPTKVFAKTTEWQCSPTIHPTNKFTMRKYCEKLADKMSCVLTKSLFFFPTNHDFFL
jgi:hypothetical protein